MEKREKHKRLSGNDTALPTTALAATNPAATISPTTLTTAALATAALTAALTTAALATTPVAASTFAATSLAPAAVAAALASADVVHRYVRIFQQRRLPGRRLRLANCPVWCPCAVRPRHGLHRLRRTLQVPAVSAAALAVSATLAAPTLATPSDGMQRFVPSRRQRRLPGRRARLPHRLVWHASAVQHCH